MTGIYIISGDCVPNDCLDMKGYEVKPVGKYNVKSRNEEELVKWMTDYEKWRVFASGVPGAVAMGGPKIRQFVNWFNEVIGHSALRVKPARYGYERYEVYYSEYHGESGFRVSIPSGRDVFYSCGDANGYWLAAISTCYGGYVFGVCGIKIDSIHCTTGLGIRPVVYLPLQQLLVYDDFELLLNSATMEWLLKRK